MTAMKATVKTPPLETPFGIHPILSFTEGKQVSLFWKDGSMTVTGEEAGGPTAWPSSETIPC